ncbi:helix-turn-helix transcriptional regulator [Pseudomonas gingeri]|uniref:helix-turn-helix domain-containing protein n=1 Tax=Pseudomonas gingeri TaxID=117681 RepID=UPI0015A2FC36|nr:helix-turn-helix transcriptional regulator [Pseudomonas gingeri]NWD70745.1 helix-turn-helix transcriptional regulator [Pseudomonas gingeri]NWD72889.1 helix-turn-helix transcriptional regulator [Pseudomonas gingeri]
MNTPRDDGYAPVVFDPQGYAAQRSQTDDVFAVAYTGLQDEFAALDVLLRARKSAGLTQAEVAERMGVKPSALARIEMSLASRKHSPSLETLRKYAQACGKSLTIGIA